MNHPRFTPLRKRGVNRYFAIQRTLQPGEAIQVTIERGAKTMQIQVVLPAGGKGKK